MFSGKLGSDKGPIGSAAFLQNVDMYIMQLTLEGYAKENNF
jgi:hypothetical protein